MGNQNSTIIQAGGSVNFKEMLPEHDIPEADIAPLRDAWVDVPGAEVARKLLETTGIAVVAGRPGTGRHGTAIRVLLEESLRRAEFSGRHLLLKQIPTDWDKPDASALPVNPERGYLIDVSAEIDKWGNAVDVAAGFISYASRLRSKGSCLIVISSDHGWPYASPAINQVRVQIDQPPPAKKVAANHITNLHGQPTRAAWLDDEEFSALLANDAAPATAAKLAVSISTVADDNQSRRKAAEEFLQWPSELNKIFGKEEEGDAEGRALLIAAAFLEGSTSMEVQKASQLLLGDTRAEKRSVREILAAPNLTARLRRLGVTVKDRHVSFADKPGLGTATLHHVWQERMDLHEPLLNWIGALTAPGRLAEPYLDPIAEILTDLAIRQNDLRPIELAQEWAGSSATTERLSLAARMLGKAATSDVLGSTIRAALRTWAASESESLATITALICQGDFGNAYPGQALVRLRWILQRPTRDGAVIAGEEAIKRMAARMDLLPRVWDTVTTWIFENRDRVRAGNRGLLAIIDSRTALSAVHALVAAAEKDSAFADTVVRGLASAVNDRELQTEARTVLRGWALGIADGTLPGTALDLLDRIVDDHLAASPVSALLYGVSGEADDDNVIAVRQQLWERRSANRYPFNAVRET
jgi:hypothetical protein